MAVDDDAAAAHAGADADDSTSACDIKSEILKGIGELPWFRVDVSLPGSHTHGRIVVRRPWVDSSGQDVVRFMLQVALLR